MTKLDCFGENILAGITGVEIDFKLLPEEDDVTSVQTVYLSENFGIDGVVNIRQVHGNRVVYAQSVDQVIQEADAVITDQRNVPITVRTADCVPIFLHDTVKNVIGVIHAGWQSTHKCITEETMKTMVQRCKVNPIDVQCYIGPCIRKQSFEVGDEFSEYFPNEYEVVDGQGYVDVAQANKNQLIKSGILKANISDCNEDTFTSDKWFSFRRDGVLAGRMLHVMMLK
ncbi:MAG: YfiH family protein [Candidatus Omnitrophota bacterium]|jgi:YfiH family protein